jgi:hypothetical protein
MPDDQDTQIIHAIREHDGQLDWLGVAADLGVDMMVKSDRSVALLAALVRLNKAGAYRMVFKKDGVVRFWIGPPKE